MNTHNKLVPTTAFTLLALAIAQELNAQVVDPLPVSRSVQSLRVVPAEINAVNYEEGLLPLQTCGNLDSVVFAPIFGECDDYGGGTTQSGINCVLDPVTQEVQWSLTGSEIDSDVQAGEVIAVYTENCTDDTQYGGPCNFQSRINETGRTLINEYIYPLPISLPEPLGNDAQIKLCDRAYDENQNLICGKVSPYFFTVCYDNNRDVNDLPVPPCPASAGCPTDLPVDDVSRSVISVTRISNNGQEIVSDMCLCVSPNDPNPPDGLTPCSDALPATAAGSCYASQGVDGLTQVPSDEKMSGEFYCLDIGVLRYCWDINP